MLTGRQSRTTEHGVYSSRLWFRSGEANAEYSWNRILSVLHSDSLRLLRACPWVLGSLSVSLPVPCACFWIPEPCWWTCPWCIQIIVPDILQVFTSGRAAFCTSRMQRVENFVKGFCIWPFVVSCISVEAHIRLLWSTGFFGHLSSPNNNYLILISVDEFWWTSTSRCNALIT